MDFEFLEVEWMGLILGVCIEDDEDCLLIGIMCGELLMFLWFRFFMVFLYGCVVVIEFMLWLWIYLIVVWGGWIV